MSTGHLPVPFPGRVCLIMNTIFHIVPFEVRPTSVMESQNDMPSLARESISLRNEVKELELERTRLEERLREARSASQTKDEYVPTVSEHRSHANPS